MVYILILLSLFSLVSLAFLADFQVIFIALTTGLIISTLIYLMTVEWPQIRLRRAIGGKLRRAYHDFKRGTITLLIQASGGIRSETNSDSLLDFKVFREYFSSSGNQKWYDALNARVGVHPAIPWDCSEPPTMLPKPNCKS
ncbi:hypothetical protein C4J81_01980 [Deltaproteobacteria bacterium Smac51]|nr:hypothetical protein C4J81_01980 [Deltaproteobacteria bacterium Smac51]